MASVLDSNVSYLTKEKIIFVGLDLNLQTSVVLLGAIKQIIPATFKCFLSLVP